MSEQFTGFNPNQPDRKPQYSEPLTNGFTGDVFEPKKLWGKDSPLATHIFSRPPVQKIHIAIHDRVSLQAGWGVEGDYGYAPSYTSTRDEDPNKFGELYEMSLSEGNVARLYPFTKKYTAILPAAITDVNADTFYRQHHTDEEIRANMRPDGGLPTINFLFDYFKVGRKDIHPEKLFRANNVTEFTRLKVFGARVIQDRMNGNKQSVEQFAETISRNFGSSIYQVVSDLNAAILPFAVKQGMDKVAPLLLNEPGAKAKYYQVLAELIAETGLQQIKYAPGQPEHTFFPFYATKPEQLCSLDFYPYLMESYAVFCANIPEYLQEGKAYSPDRVTSDVRNLYNYFFKLLGKEKELAFKPADSLKGNAFGARCEFVKRKLLETYQSSKYKGNRELAIANVEKLFGTIEDRIPYIEAVIDIPIQRLAQFNKLQGNKNRQGNIPTIGERLNTIRSHGRRISSIRGAWELLTGDPRDF